MVQEHRGVGFIGIPKLKAVTDICMSKEGMHRHHPTDGCPLYMYLVQVFLPASTRGPGDESKATADRLGPPELLEETPPIYQLILLRN